MDEHPKCLDLCCCAGGASMGYHRAGFEVVGVDIEPQPDYPFKFIQADALDYLLDNYQDYDFIHVSPPCQAYSVTKNMHDNEYPDLVGLFRYFLNLTDKPYVMENVPGSPLINYISLDGTMFDLRVIRKRYFESNLPLVQPGKGIKKGYTSKRGKGYSTFDNAYYITVAGNNFRYSDAKVAMDIDWMPRKSLKQAIPPIYTHFVGLQVMYLIKDNNE